MIEHKSRFRSVTPDLDGYDQDYDQDHDRDFGDSIAPPAPVRFGRSTAVDDTEASVPLFLSDPDGAPEPDEFAAPLRKRRWAAVSSKLLAAVVAASGVAMAVAWFSSDATRDMIVTARASIAAALRAPAATAQADAAQLTPGDLQLSDPRHAAPQGRQTARAPVVLASAAPSREAIATAYQSALQARAPVAVAAPRQPQPPAAPPQAKPIDPQELAMLMKRATDMLAVGDIPSARLLLERAAEGQDADAAMMLARTYDPAVLGSADVRNITPEPERARLWYQRAAQFGSAEAQQRLAQLPN